MDREVVVVGGGIHLDGDVPGEKSQNQYTVHYVGRMKRK